MPESLMDFMARGAQTKHPNPVIQKILSDPQGARSDKPSIALPIAGAVLSGLLGNTNPIGAYSQMRGSQLAQHGSRDFGEALSNILQEQGGEAFSRTQLGKIAKIREAYTGQVGAQFEPLNLSGTTKEYDGKGKFRMIYTNREGESRPGEWVPIDPRSGGLNEGQQNSAEYYRAVRNEWASLPKARRDRYVRFMQGRPTSIDMLSDADQESIDMYTRAFLGDKNAVDDPNYWAMREDFLKLRRGDKAENYIKEQREGLGIEGSSNEPPEMLKRVEPPMPELSKKLIEALPGLTGAPQESLSFGAGQKVGSALKGLFSRDTLDSVGSTVDDVLSYDVQEAWQRLVDKQKKIHDRNVKVMQDDDRLSRFGRGGL